MATSEVTLGLLFSRICAMHQTNTYRPDLPVSAALSKEEINDLKQALMASEGGGPHG